MKAGLTIGEALSRAAGRLAASGADSPALDARLLLSRAASAGREELLLRPERILSAPEAEAFEALVARRETGEPVAYILGVKEFYGRDFKVGPGVLIPRPETEHLVEAVIERVPAHRPVAFADLGAGSGCLAVTLALELEGSRGLAIDLSEAALEIAAANAARHGVADRITFSRADFRKPFSEPGSLGLVVSNPPYVTREEMAALDRGVAGFEPHEALDGGEDGLMVYGDLVAAASLALESGGLLALEMGWKQGRAVSRLLTNSGDFRDISVLPDLAGRDRVALARRL